MEQSYADTTDYPKLFKETYWGRFGVEPKSDISLFSKNRNEFAKKYNLNPKSSCTWKIPYEYKMEIRCKGATYTQRAECDRNTDYDHFECYRAKVDDVDSLILIISPYSSFVPKSIIEPQWEKVAPLYSSNANTWQLIVPVQELKKPLTRKEKSGD